MSRSGYHEALIDQRPSRIVTHVQALEELVRGYLAGEISKPVFRYELLKLGCGPSTIIALIALKPAVPNWVVDTQCGSGNFIYVTPPKLIDETCCDEGQAIPDFIDEDGPMDLEDQLDAAFALADSVCQDCNFRGGTHAADCTSIN